MFLKIIPVFLMLILPLAACQSLFYGDDTYPVDFNIYIAADEGPGKLRIYFDSFSINAAAPTKDRKDFMGFNLYRSPDSQNGTYLQRAFEYRPTRDSAGALTGFIEWREGSTNISDDTTPFSFTDTCQPGRMYFYTARKLWYNYKYSTIFTYTPLPSKVYQNGSSATVGARCP